MSIPSSLSNFILRKVKLTLSSSLSLNQQVSETELESAAQALVHSLASLHPLDKKLFSETGLKLAKAVSALTLSPSSLRNIDGSVLNEWLQKYDEYLQNNHTIFESITNHHTSISCENWSNVVRNAGALSEYASAAASMGSKIWVAECNQWMETFALNYFRQGGARKHFIKQQRLRYKGVDRTKTEIDVENAEFAKLQSDLLSTADSVFKMRLLDVGSCYNPFKQSANVDQMDVTALDLCPTDSSVYQCDFLGLQVGAVGSVPVIVHAAEDKTTENEPHAKRQRIASNDNQDNIAQPTTEMSLCLKQLPGASYDVIVMSLVLNYLPTSEQRLNMIRKARALLVSPRSEAPSTAGKDSNVLDIWPPHRNGLLLIAEKQSIFKSPVSNSNPKYVKNTKKTVTNAAESATGVQENDSEGGAGIDLYSNWVRAICGCGFELVKYQFLNTSDGRKSHLFAFATVNINSIVVDSSIKLSIKQDFDK